MNTVDVEIEETRQKLTSLHVQEAEEKRNLKHLIKRDAPKKQEILREVRKIKRSAAYISEIG